MESANEYPHKRRKNNTSLRSQNRGPAHGNSDNPLRDSLTSAKTYNRGQHRASTACETCRWKKVKCDEGSPVCTFCTRHGFRCVYQVSPDQEILRLRERLIQAEERLEELESRLSVSLPDRRGSNSNYLESHWTHSNTGIATPVSTTNPNGFATILSTPGQIDIDTPSDITSPSESHGGLRSEDKTPNSTQDVTTASKDILNQVYYSTRTPFECEESRTALPNVLNHTEQTKCAEIIPFLEYFFEHTCPLFPIICDQVTLAVGCVVAERGFQDDLQSCLILFIVALSKAYRVPTSLESGLSDFQRALQALGRIPVQFTLEYAQSQVLAALFLFKKGRLLGFWSYLHTGCTALCAMIRRDINSNCERDQQETKTILRLYWICFNLERDLQHEVDNLPRSELFRLEDHLPLPLGCDEFGTIHMQAATRTVYTFFLAEMSLKAILARILTTPDLEYPIQTNCRGNVELSPLIQEFKLQIQGWEENLPSFLGWSPEPTKGIASAVGVRLKLLYWFARFSIFKPLINQALHDPSYQLRLLEWKSFQDGLLAGLNMVKVSIMEKPDIDVIMGNRLVSAVTSLKGAVGNGSFTTQCDEDLADVLQDCIDILWRSLAWKSEWITCRLQAL